MKQHKKINVLLVCLLLALGLAACSSNSSPANPTNTLLPAATAVTIPTPNLAAGTPARATAEAVQAASTATPLSAALTANAPTTAAVKKGGALVTAVTSDVKTLHYYKTSALLGFTYNRYLYNAFLTQRDPKTLELTGLAAKSWSIDPATATVTFKLRDGLKWSDGKPITADDYVWTWQQAIKKENAWPAAASVVYDPNKGQADTIKDYSAPDPQTLKITLGGLVFNAVQAADVVQPMPRHIWEGKDWNDPTKNPEIDSPTVVSGAWKLKEWVRDSRFVVVRNDASTVIPPANVDSLTYVIVPNATVGFQKLKNGEVDFLASDVIAPQDVAEMETLPSITTYKWQKSTVDFTFVGVNFRRPYLQDPKLRQALMWTLDKKGMIDRILYGLAVPVYSDVVPASVFYNDKVEKYGYDPEKAKKILTDAGYKIDNGKLIDPKGQPLPKMKFLHSAPNPVREKIAQVLQDEWKKLGIEIEISTADNATIIATLQKEPFDFDFWIGNWVAGENPETFGGIWSNTPARNRGAWVNDEVFKLYSDVVKELDLSKRKEIMSKIQEIEARELPYLYFYADLGFIGVNKRIGGVVPSALGVNYNTFADWYIK